jgi:hypothetical protein
MEEFDQLQKIWKSQKPAHNLPDASVVLHAVRTTKDKLVKKAVMSSLIFLCVSVYVFILQGSLTLSDTSQYAVFGLVLVCFAQSLLQGYSWRTLVSIDELQSPAAHICAWENYYVSRKKMLRISGPVYFAAINTAMGVFFIDVLLSFAVWQRVVIVAIYVIWMSASWFVIRKKIIRHEYQRITEIIRNLNMISGQLHEDTSAKGMGSLGW